ncbi:MAG TPA: alpha/beta fold hydrolase [Gemmatimonadaceae bacterium]|nr:alpha/beta fold hydrolase [Gemmatimonadaceae bacterium]
MPPIPPPRESGYTTRTPVPLYWCAYGPAGARRLLVLHGGPGADHQYLLPQMLALADEYELVLYDQRGGGKSRTDDPAPITWQTHVEDLAAVAAELDLGAPELIGYSWGGLLAMLYATEAARSDSSPTAPTALILIDPAPVTREYRAQFEAEFSRRQQSEQIQRLRSELAASDLRERDPEAYRHRAFELSVAGYFADPERARDLTPFRVIGRVQQSVWGSLGDFDLVPQLRQVDLPAIVIHGREDPIPLASSEAVADALGARLVVIDDCGHVPYVEQPQSLFDAVREFLTESSPLPQRDAP